MTVQNPYRNICLLGTPHHRNGNVKDIIMDHIIVSVLEQFLTGRHVLFQVLNGRKDRDFAPIGLDLIIGR